MRKLTLAHNFSNAFSNALSLSSFLAGAAATLSELHLTIASQPQAETVLGMAGQVNLGVKTLCIGLSDEAAMVLQGSTAVTVAAVVNRMRQIDTLSITSSDTELFTHLFANLDPNLQIIRLTCNLRTSLFHSAGDVETWLTAPALASLRLLVLRGTRSRAFSTKDGQALIAAAEARGVEVFVRHG